MRFFETMKRRREFLRSTGRYAALGFLGLIGGGALLRKPSANSDCEPFPLCQGCGAFDDCSLPQALKEKTTQERRHGQA
ncbi:MAG: hypothetical protein P9L94_13950 [Candidatus Hinthialibacter antarcticus]|nr:hypothetical protein [Candidatus Hinthialibacter antarcticus]